VPVRLIILIFRRLEVEQSQVPTSGPVNAAWLPLSTIWPSARTRTRSASRMDLNLCEMNALVRPPGPDAAGDDGLFDLIGHCGLITGCVHRAGLGDLKRSSTWFDTLGGGAIPQRRLVGVVSVVR